MGSNVPNLMNLDHLPARMVKPNVCFDLPTSVVGLLLVLLMEKDREKEGEGESWQEGGKGRPQSMSLIRDTTLVMCKLVTKHPIRKHGTL